MALIYRSDVLAMYASDGKSHNAIQGYYDAKVFLDAFQRTLDTLECPVGYYDLLAWPHGKVVILDEQDLFIETVDNLLEVHHITVWDIRYLCLFVVFVVTPRTHDITKRTVS